MFNCEKMVHTVIVNPAVPKVNIPIPNAPTAKPEKLPKLVIYFFRLYQIIFCIDLGFYEYKSFKTKFFCQFVAISQAFTLCLVCILSFFNSMYITTAIWYTTFLIQYLLTVCVINLNTKDMTFHKFLNTLLVVDFELIFQCFKQTCVKMFVFMTLSTAASTFSILTYCNGYPEYCISSVLIQFLFTIPSFALDTFLILYFFIFYSVYHRLMRLTNILNKNFTNIASCQFLYKSIVENTLKVKASFDIVVSIIDIVLEVTCFTIISGAQVKTY